MFGISIGIFLLGIILIAMEDKIRINKAAIALLMSFGLWYLVAVDTTIVVTKSQFVEHLGNVSETLFFVMGAMAIVELIDTHGGFKVITDTIRTRKKRRLMVILSFITFFMSALLDNLATGIIMITLLRKIIPHRTERWIYASMIIIAANAGGSWSPIGDVTTILLWTGGCLTPAHQVLNLFIPALISMCVPLWIATRFFSKDASWNTNTRRAEDNSHLPTIGSFSRKVILYLGIGTMCMVPVMSELTGLPPFMCIIMGMGVLWVYTDFMYNRIHKASQSKVKLSLVEILSRVDMSTIMFFLGILMSVAALDTAGHLKVVSDLLSSTIESPLMISATIGVMSSFVDNVALVAATMGMYDIVPGSMYYMMNGEFWTFLAYCAVTGGSLLIIGSATGVTVMGLEHIPFMYYVKRFSLLALAGYASGAITYLGINYLEHLF